MQRNKSLAAAKAMAARRRRAEKMVGLDRNDSKGTITDTAQNQNKYPAASPRRTSASPPPTLSPSISVSVPALSLNSSPRNRQPMSPLGYQRSWPPEAHAEIKKLRNQLSKVTKERDALATLLNGGGTGNHLQHLNIRNGALPSPEASFPW